MTSGNFKLVKKIKDEQFDVEKLHQYSLSMQVGIRDFQFCITDIETNTCLMMEDYLLEGVKTINTRLEVLAKLFENMHLKIQLLSVLICGTIHLHLVT